jgi:hypothetical protein
MQSSFFTKRVVNSSPPNSVHTTVFKPDRARYDTTKIKFTKDVSMAKSWELLDKAYTLVNAGYVPQAQFIIHTIITHNPQNIEAWELYISTIDEASELEELKDSVESLWASGVRAKDYLDANRRFILRRINERIDSL